MPTPEAVDALVSSHDLSSEAAQNLKKWLRESAYADYTDEIATLFQNENFDELEDAFRTNIEFGTGGIRGKMGAGPNRINARTIGEAAQGLAQYVLKSGIENAAQKGVVIACDTRNKSDVFSRETASIFAGNGITARIFSSHRATPELSFALRETGAVTGVVISASHNPPSDNGFKAYWDDGGQVVPPHDRNIIEEVKAVGEITRLDFDEGVQKGLIHTLGEEIDTPYIGKLAELSLNSARDIAIVFTPLHGVGATSIVPALHKLGYQGLKVVAEQNTPDGNFPTVANGVANPEDPNALSLAISEARETDADLVLASDPDADRLGCALPHATKGWDAEPHELAINGNQIGVILAHYILDTNQKTGTLPPKALVCKTIVTTDLITLIAKHFHAKPVDNLLVGFKYIAEVINNLAEDETFLFGTEESHGYLSGDFVRDKDAAAAAVLLSECAAQLKSEGKTVREYLDNIYRQFGYFHESQKATYREGAQGNREITQIMIGLRENSPTQIGGHEVVEVIDYQSGQAKNLKTGAIRTLDAGKGNVLAFTFTEAGHTRVTARPSGTEPKIKYYISATSADHPQLASNDLVQSKQNIDSLANEIITGMLEAADQALG
ncbi:MAG: phospho-sugar mutase [Candidatus Latescibacteria bacterium]|nr:phospho-sugar mutase [Candidatus Latescibacterota bacterium]MBT5831366.1 phospho-sugar mutase [Candidatus Latescibacterota bacterium]